MTVFGKKSKSGASAPTLPHAHDHTPLGRQVMMAVAEVSDQFVNLEGIPILETGISYPASTGPFTVTKEMIEEVILSQDDPHVVAPRIKIGHIDNPLNEELQQLFEDANTGLGESEPALGTIQNMRTEEDGHVLLGDWYGLPAWLAAILESAYPARSIEGGQWHNPANDKEYAFTLTAVSLLGVIGPGCTSLEDLQTLFSAEGPNVTVIEMNRKESGSMGVIAQVNVEDIRRAFYDDFAQGDRYWWWDRELLIDPNEMIVEDPDEGQLYRVAIELDGDGTEGVSFGEPESIKVQYVPDPKPAKDEEGTKASTSSVLIAPQLERAGKVLAVNSHAPRESERTKEASVDPAKELRKHLGLPEDATDEDVQTALAADGEPNEGDEPQVEEENGGEGDETPAPEGEVEVPVAASNDAVTVDPGTLAQLQADAAQGKAAREAQLEQAREAHLQAAVKAGKFPPARLEHWRGYYKADPDGAKAAIEALTPGLIPVDEHGAAPSAAELSSQDAYPASWLSPQERSRASGERVTQEVGS